MHHEGCDMECSKKPRDGTYPHGRKLKRVQEDSRETVGQKRLWWKSPDGIAILPPIGNKTGVFCILEYKRMSDVTDQYLLWVRLKTEEQYVSLRSTLNEAIRHQGCKVEQISFITGSRSVNEQDLRKNLGSSKSRSLV